MKDEFTRQFREAKERVGLTRGPAIERMESSMRDVSKRIEIPLTHATWAVVIALLLGGPVFDLILLAFALYRGRQGTKHLLNYLHLLGQKRGRRREMEHELRQLDCLIAAKNKAFRRAVDSLDESVHPQLQTLVGLLCDVDGGPFVPEKSQQVGDIPDVSAYLRDPEYVERIQPEDRPLLDSSLL